MNTATAASPERCTQPNALIKMEIEDFISLLDDSARDLGKLHESDITIADVETALYMRLADKYAFEWRGSLWDIEISKQQIIEILEDFDFSTLTSTIETDRDIFPPNLLMEYKVRVKSGGILWTIHLFDRDPFPSNPHAHQLDNNIKLDLSTGKCYKNRTLVDTLNKKNLLDIRTKAQKVFKGELPPLLV
jgi:hypothetical protein